MATRAEARHAEDQRHGITPRAKKRAKARKTRAEKLGKPHESGHAGAKASYAREAPSIGGRASRKSSRSSANRSKPDTNLNLREERDKRSPENRFRKARARGSRVRGSRAA
jgi:hypothetical protein